MLANLRSIIQAVNAANSLQETYSIIIERVSAQLETSICSLFIRMDESDEYRLEASLGLDPSLNHKLKVPADGSLVGLIASREEPLKVEHVQSHESFFPIPGIAENAAVSFLGIPILHHREVLGVLVVQHPAPHNYSEDDEAFLITLCAQLAAIITNASLRDQIEHKGRGKELATHFVATSASPGIAIGKGFLMLPPADLSAVPERACTDVEAEIKSFRAALNKARADIRKLSDELSGQLEKQQLALFDAYQQLLSRKSIGADVEERISKDKVWAPYALSLVIQDLIERFQKMEDPYLKERATDVDDLGRRVLAHLQNQIKDEVRYPKNTILVAEKVTTAMIAEVPTTRLKGIVSIHGSSASHAALFAKSLGIPAVLGLRDCPVTALEGKQLIVDGYEHQLLVRPNQALKRKYQERQESEQRLLKKLQTKRRIKAKTRDGRHIPLYINTGMMTDTELEPMHHHDGVGLFRSEYPFMMADRFPSEEEQVALYEPMLQQNKGKPVIIRTLDIGGDKNLAYFPIEEDNPFLGWRGIRVSLDHPEIFLTQIRAMLRANIKTRNLKIALPMISTISEVDESLILIHQTYSEVLKEFNLNEETYPMPKVGLVIEVPAAIYQLDRMAERVDFISVGTNDLTQYLFAVDRNNSRVSYLYRSLHPAVVSAVAVISQRTKRLNKPVYICGEMAGDPLAIPLLIAMQIDGLSMNIQNLPKARKVIAKLSQREAKAILNKALSCSNNFEVTEYMKSVLNERKLLDLVSPGAQYE